MLTYFLKEAVGPQRQDEPRGTGRWESKRSQTFPLD